MFFKLHNNPGGVSPTPLHTQVSENSASSFPVRSVRWKANTLLGRWWSLSARTLQLGVGAGSQIYDCMEKQEKNRKTSARRTNSPRAQIRRP